jgi:transposase-like protein
MKFQYRKFGDMYYVSELHSYDSVNKVYKSEHIGTVKKSGNQWIGETLQGDMVQAETREKASIAMIEELEREGMNLQEQNLKDLSIEDQTKWASEQQSNGKTYAELAKQLNVNESTLKSRIKTFRKKNGIESTPRNEKRGGKQINTKVNIDVQPFTEEEIEVLKGIIEDIEVLKEIIQEHQLDVSYFHEYRIYEELKKVPRDAEPVRSAFNMSKETTERLKKFASVRMIPLQSLVELAVINLLEKYDK